MPALEPKAGSVQSTDTHPAHSLTLVTPHDTNANRYRSFLINVTVAGNLRVRGLLDAADVDIPFPVGFFEVHVATALIKATGTTLTGTIIGLV